MPRLLPGFCHDAARQGNDQITPTTIAPTACPPAPAAESFRHLLRRSTARDHHRVEKLFAPMLADPVRHLDRFLQAQAAGFAALRQAAPDLPGGSVLPQVLDVLRADCAARGLAVPRLAAPHRLDPLAAEYIATGSRLGTEVLRRRLTEAGHAPLPRSFTATQAPAEWRALCTLLDGIDPASPRAARICADARRAFQIFALAAQAPPAASPPRQAPPRPAQTRKDLLLG
ncbi:hypothetical protein ACFSDD_07445 [Salipiger marinus]|uniref:hypothetical protein n=1 Tax=Salipiger marinus TaxID=555512 RepID=UPI001E42F08C|nr:hypothetical protein [Salipiger manganoxidans]MCD1619265.1 hypothetical protein [Salipiger manganoxidans]MEB3419322.1 hypothetical protein [Salipiger manganoxidans]